MEKPTADDQNVFVARDQLEREIIWSALAEYRAANPDQTDVISDMILRVQSTFAWVRDSD